MATFVRGLTYQRAVKKQKEREEEMPGKKRRKTEVGGRACWAHTYFDGPPDTTEAQGEPG